MNKEEFSEMFYSKLGEDYILTKNNFVNTKSVIEAYHKVCGNYYTTRAENITRTKFNKCPICNKSIKKNMKSLQTDIDNIFGIGIYEIVSPKFYKNNKMDIMVRCSNCNNTFNTKPYRITSNKNGCPYCSGTKKTDDKIIKDKLEKIFGKGNIIPNGIHKEEKGTFVSVSFNDCDHSYDINLSDISQMMRNKNKTKCKFCSHHIGYTNDSLKEEISKRSNGEFLLESTEYVNQKSVITVRHIQDGCNKTFQTTADNFLNKCMSCPFDNRSKPIKDISEFLEKNSISFEQEKKFEGMKRQNYLPYDLYLKDLNMIIEYDGEMHFSNHFTNGDQYLKIQKENDREKDLFIAEKTNYKFVRIPFVYKKDILDLINLLINDEFTIIQKEFPNVLLITEYNSPKRLRQLNTELKRYAKLDTK